MVVIILVPTTSYRSVMPRRFEEKNVYNGCWLVSSKKEDRGWRNVRSKSLLHSVNGLFNELRKAVASVNGRNPKRAVPFEIFIVSVVVCRHFEFFG